MSYLVLARKYRPQTFDEVVCQDHVTKTLMNSIEAKRVAHAILFAGPRGTGKTTIARIMAKAMNCAEGPTPVPCNECISCTEITSGKSLDVLEIDGASNNGVEQIRELCENAKYKPARSPFKIYIIDEVHMLSVNAFNALLKTLEEPPAHVLFFFATTEPHKIPITILSRCQRYDLKRVGIKSMIEHMSFICGKENININEKTLELIAIEGTGSVRDSLSLLDQVISCSKGDVSYENVLDILGIVDRKLLFSMGKAVIKGKTSDALNILHDIYLSGYDIKKLYTDLLEFFRNIIVMSVGTGGIIDASSFEIEEMRNIAKGNSISFFNQIFDILFKYEYTLRYSSKPKIFFEMALINLGNIKPLFSLDTLIEKLDELKKNLSLKEESINEEIEEPILFDEEMEIEELEKPPKKRYIDLEDKNAILEKALYKLKKARPALHSYLKKSEIEEISGDNIILKVYGSDFVIETLLEKKNIDDIAASFSDIIGKKVNISIKADKEKSDEKALLKRKETNLKDTLLNHPVTEEILKVFKGEFLEIYSKT